MANQKFTHVDLYVNGNKLLRDVEVSVEVESGTSDVFSLGSNQYDGVTQGTRKLKINWSTNVPDAGFEYNPHADIAAGSFVNLTLVAASASLSSDGTIKTSKMSQGTDANAKQEVAFSGTYADWVAL